jgi:Luciferase-like monooxygenase
VNLGVFGLNAKSTHSPGQTLRLAQRAEALGYTSWWAGEHVVLPSPRTADSPMEPTDPILDPLVHLAYVAAATERIALGTGVIVLPQRNPVVLAKQVASLDVLSAGRLLLGVGSGGHNQAAFRRAVARGHGWYGIGTQYDLIAHLSGLRRAAAEVDRPARLGRLEILYQQLNPVTVDADAARLYADLGVDHLVLYPQPLEDPAEVTRFLELHADLPR